MCPDSQVASADRVGNNQCKSQLARSLSAYTISLPSLTLLVRFSKALGEQGCITQLTSFESLGPRYFVP